MCTKLIAIVITTKVTLYYIINGFFFTYYTNGISFPVSEYGSKKNKKKDSKLLDSVE